LEDHYLAEGNRQAKFMVLTRDLLKQLVLRSWTGSVGALRVSVLLIDAPGLGTVPIGGVLLSEFRVIRLERRSHR
jgi:hypothetical protein